MIMLKIWIIVILIALLGSAMNQMISIRSWKDPDWINVIVLLGLYSSGMWLLATMP